jgi:plastocyanin
MLSFLGYNRFSMDFLATLIASRASEPEQHPRPFLWGLILAALVLMAIAVSIFGTDTPSKSEPAPSATVHREARVYTVTYRYGIFSPTNLRIHVGDTVRFLNGTPDLIRITADRAKNDRVPLFDSKELIQPDGLFSYTFATAGVFGYHNDADTNEAGVIIVRE